MGMFQPTVANHPVLMEQIKQQYKEESELFGYSMTYYRPVETENGQVFAESTARNFLESNGTNMFYKRTEDEFFGGDESFGGFGLLPSYKLIVFVSVLYFEESNLREPIEGDLIYDNLNNLLLEISKVDPLTESQLSTKLADSQNAWRIYLKEYEWSYKDSIESSIVSDLETEFTDQDLDDINDALNDDIDLVDAVDDTEVDAVFGIFG